MGQELLDNRHNMHDSSDRVSLEVVLLLCLLLPDLLQMREEEKQPDVQRRVS